jgi:hypothetical protein
MDLSLPGKVADQLLLLGVDADHRIARRQVRGFESGDVLELRVPVRMRSQGFFLAHFALSQAVPPHQLANRVATRRRSHLRQTTADLAARQVGPQYAFPHGIARRELGQQPAKVFFQPRLPFRGGFPAPTFFF